MAIKQLTVPGEIASCHLGRLGRAVHQAANRALYLGQVVGMCEVPLCGAPPEYLGG
jgi:hypothetical protein